ncbi:MAG: hypothetical protein ABI605_15475 [Rhizobacter sp.]
MTKFASLPAIEAIVDQDLRDQRYDDALAHMVLTVHNHYKSPEATHRHLYYPVFDRQIEQLSAALVQQCPAPQVQPPLSRNTLIIATQLYQVGGHSRVVEDFARELESPTVVLTDTFSTYRNDPSYQQWVHPAYGDTPVIALPQPGPWAKCRALLALVRRLQPRNIFYFNHHQDPIGFIGTLGHAGSRKTLVHHADHNPSLGVTLPSLAHADFTDELAAICTHELHKPTTVVPLYVPDLGCKVFSEPTPAAMSVVTSGTQIKFARTGELSLQAIACAVLRSVGGQFFHIGPLDADWLAEIHAHLAANGITPQRFAPLGSVSSLWGTLASLDAHVYLGSAPVGGARAAIEAQGCGYPLCFYRVDDPSSLVAVDSLYANKSLGWTTLAQLSGLLKGLAPAHAQLSQEARGFYDARFSRQELLRVLAQLCEG